MAFTTLRDSSAMVYDPLPGGQPASSTIRQARYRAQRSQLFIYSAAFISASLLVLIVARIGHSGADSSVAGAGGSPQQSTAKDTDQSKWNLKWLPGHSPTRPSLDHQGLPQLDWSWPSTWLSKRPSIGSPTWMQRYPGSVHGPPPRQSWLDRYYAAKAKGLIPDLPKAELIGGLPNYPADLPLDARLCSYRRSSCLGEEDIYKAPAAHWAVNFDDGPLPPSAALYEKLDEWNEHATHFWVGNNVKTHWQLAVQAATRGDHLAVHTWSHPHLTTYTNEQVVGELGWAMQIIYDISDHIPKYYRPPFGDNDARVRAIAKHVFNMTAIIWNHDSYDWSLNQTWAIGDFVDPPYDWLTTKMSTDRLIERMQDNDKINGEGVIVLEHELSFESIRAFTDSYPTLRKKEWISGPVPDMLDLPWYQN